MNPSRLLISAARSLFDYTIPKDVTVVLQICILAQVLLVGCSGSDTPTTTSSSGPPAPEETAENIVAVFDGGQIAIDDVDAAIVRMPAKERMAFGSQNLPAFEDLVRELAVFEILKSDAQSSGFAQSKDYVTALGEMRRQVLVHQVLMSYPLDIDEPEEADARSRYEQTLERFGEPERRFVLTVFRRVPNGDAEGRERAVEELTQVRRRVLDGESFAVLAASTGDSEARASDGAIGWVQRGTVAEDLENIVFSLAEEVPSEPVVTSQGVHLFYVDTIVEGQIPEFDAVKSTILNTLMQERRSAAIQKLAQETELPASAMIPDLTNSRILTAGDDPEQVLLSLDGFQLTRGELRKRVLKEHESVDFDPRSLASLGLATLRAITQREVLAHRFAEEGFALAPQIEERFGAQAKEFLVQRYTEHLVNAEVMRRESELRDFYALHKNRFVQPMAFRLEAIVVKDPEQPVEVMAALENLVESLEKGDASFEEAAQTVSGTVETSDWVTISALVSHRPRAAYFAPGLQIGEVSPPYSNDNSLELFRVVDRREPVPLAFEQARTRVIEAFIDRHGQKLYEELISRRLNDAGLTVYPERFTKLLTTVGAGNKPVST